MSSKKAGVILGYVAMAITNVSSFFLTPLMLSVFGTSEFGVYKLVLSITSYFALADLGLSNAVVRYISEYKAVGDKASESKFIGLVALIDFLMGFILLSVGIVFYVKTSSVFKHSFTTEEIQLFKQLFFLVVTSGIMTLFVNLAAGIMKSYERFSMLKSINIAKTVLRVFLIGILLLFKRKSFEIVLVDTVLMILVFIYSWYYCVAKLNTKVAFKGIDPKYSRKILSYSLIVFVDAIAFHFFWAADSFIIGIYISSAAIAVYSIGTLLSSLFFAFSIVISDVLMPDVVNQVASGTSNYDLTTHMIKIGRIKFIVLALPTIAFIFFGREFILLWVGRQFMQAYAIALLTLLPQMISALTDVGFYVMWAKNKHKTKSFVSLGICLTNIVLSIILVARFGIIGAAISTCLAFVAGYIIFNSIYFQLVLKLDMFRFVKQTFSRVWIGFLISIASCFLISLLLTTGWVFFIAKCISASIIYWICLWFFGLNSYEKSLLSSPVLSFLSKFKRQFS